MLVYDTANDTDEPAPDLPDEPQPLATLTGFQRDVLFVVVSLDGTNPNGVEIKRELRAAYDEEINHGRLYQNLRELVDEGLVEKRPVDGRTNAYRASAAARECLEAHTAWSEWCLLDAPDEAA
jgi:DNA-binding PadR family transcriptional regulator